MKAQTPFEFVTQVFANDGLTPSTLKLTMTFGIGCPAASVTVAVTECCVPTGFTAEAGASATSAGTTGCGGEATSFPYTNCCSKKNVLDGAPSHRRSEP